MKRPLRIILPLLFALALFSCSKEDVEVPLSSLAGFEWTFVKSHSGSISAHSGSIFFINEGTGFVTGTNGVIHKTTDGGVNWVSTPNDTQADLHDVKFLDDDFGFAVGGDSGCSGDDCEVNGQVILRTTDQGNTWNVVYEGDGAVFRAVDFYDASSIIAVGRKYHFRNGELNDDLIIATSLDGGATWSEQIVSQNQKGGGQEVIVLNDNESIIISGNESKIYKTEDRGQSWRLIETGLSTPALNGMKVGENIYIGSRVEGLIKSSDGGETWQQNGLAGRTATEPNAVNAIYVSTQGVSLAFGIGYWHGGDFGSHYGSINISHDGGQSWESYHELQDINESLSEDNSIYAAHFPNPNLGYAISGGKLLKIKRITERD